MSVPIHWSPEGLPVGIQFGAAIGEEALLLQLATQLERAAPWRERIPASPEIKGQARL
jgi:amidase